MTNAIYQAIKKGNFSDGSKPQNLHLCSENSDKTYLYFVDSVNNKLLKKVNTSTFVVSTVTTRANKNIARGFHDWVSNEIYFADTEMDNTISYIWKISLVDDIITEITSKTGNIYDIWRYLNETHILYFTSSYELLEGTIDPNGDGATLQWNSIGANHFGEIDDGSTPDISNLIYTATINEDDIFTMETDTDGGFTKILGDCDSGEIYQISAYIYGKGGDVSVDGDQNGMTPQTLSFGSSYEWKTATFSGLSLVKADLDALQITISSSVFDDVSMTLIDTFDIGSLGGNDDPQHNYFDGTNWFVVDSDGYVYKYNADFSAFVASYDLSLNNEYYGITYDSDDDYWLVADGNSGFLMAYNTDWTPTIGGYDVNTISSGLNDFPIGLYNDGSIIWVTDLDGYVYKYNASSMAYIGRVYVQGSIGSYAKSICFVGSNGYLTRSNGNIYKMDSILSTLVTTYNIGENGANDTALGIFPTGGNFYVVENSNAIIYEYKSSISVTTMYCKVYYYGDTLQAVIIENLDTPTTYSNNMGSSSNRLWDISQVTIRDDQFWFLWKWSDENVELWHYDISGAAFTQDEDCGTNTELAPIQQHAISYDNSDILYFTLGVGTPEVSTIVAQVANNIGDEDYIIYYAIQWNAQTRVYSQKKYYLWFDKAGDSTWTADPLDGDVNIRIPITAGWTAQQVSDAIESAVNADGYITCDNAAGTTCTLTNDYCGACTNIADGAVPYATGLTLATTQAGVDNTYYLYTYVISTDTLTQKGTFNIALMLDRNTVSTNTPECFALEKAFAVSLTATYELKLHQIARTRGGLNYLGKITLGSGDLGVAITDYFLIIDNSGTIELWKFEDVMGTCVFECNIDAEERTWTSIDLIWINQGSGYQDPPERDQFIQVFGRYSSYTLGSPYYGDDLLIAEGLVRSFNLDLEQEVRVESLAQEELNFAPNITSYTNYTGKTSGQVITQLLTDYCKTITAGTIVNGSITWTCPADWSVAGDKSIEVILNELADSENFSWRLRPNCKLDFDAGNVDSQMNFASTDSYGEQEARLLSQQINQIIVYGGFVNGVQVGPYYANDTNHQLLYGNIVKWSKSYTGIFDATALQTIATNKLAIQGAKPLVFWCERYCATDWGFVQVGETVDIGAGVKVAPNSTQTLTAGAYIVNRNKFDAKNNVSEIKISDGMLFLEEGSETLPEQNSELIQQIAENISPNPIIPTDHTAIGSCVVSMTAGEALVFGNICYFKSDSKMWKSDSSATTTMPVMAMAIETISADASGRFLFYGFARDDSWNWTIGGKIYLSSTAGSATQTVPAGEEVQIIGIAISADVMFVNPIYNHNSDIAYAATWDTNYDTLTKNAIYDALGASFNTLKCRIKTGTYTGTDTDNRAFSGFGFTPKVFFIYHQVGSNVYSGLVSNTLAVWTSISIDAALNYLSNRINIDSDGFSVNHSEAGDYYNNLGEVYHYIAWG